MTAADFPVFFQLLATERGTIDRAYPRSWIERTEMAIETLAEAVAAGSIANPVFKDVKDRLNRSMEDAWQRIDRPGFGWGGTERTAPEAILDVCSTYPYPSAHTLAFLTRKVEACPDHPVRTACLAFLQEIKPLADGIIGLKGKVVKRQPKTEAEKKAERYRAPVSSSKAVGTVQVLLRQIVDKQFQGLKQAFFDYNMQIVAAYETGLNASDADPTLNEVLWGGKHSDEYTLPWHFSNRKTARNEKKVYADSVALAANAFEYGVRPTGKRGMVKMADAEQIMLDRATRDAEDVRDYFVAKNLRKIVSILEAKGDDEFDRAEIVDQSVDMSGLRGSIRFFFRDGSAFTCRNEVVFVVNVYGTRFYRFPLTFTNVVMPGGAPMKSPSEKRMNTVFLGKEVA